MKLDDLQIFLDVYRLGSFAAVARHHNSDPSLISRRIAHLENAMGTRLFHRSTRQLSPTQNAKQLAAHIAPLLETVDALKQNFMDPDAPPHGNIRISASIAFAQSVLLPHLTEFQNLYPDIRFDLVLSDQRLDLTEHRIDLAVRHGTLPDSALIARRLMQTRYVCVASPDYLARYGQPRHPDDLAAHSLLSFNFAPFDKAWHANSKSTPSQAPIHIPVSPKLKVSNATILQDAALAGWGVALLADWMCRDNIQDGRFIPVLTEWHWSGGNSGISNPETGLSHPVHLIFPSRHFIPRPVRLLADYLIQAVKKD